MNSSTIILIFKMLAVQVHQSWKDHHRKIHQFKSIVCKFVLLTRSGEFNLDIGTLSDIFVGPALEKFTICTPNPLGAFFDAFRL